ncbi:unnamed protein product [Rotaria sp. Silwood1]|nr:unnamed protein product [Rotaria sp. Silwood1]
MTHLTTDKDQLVFGYWAARGRGEPSRLLLHYTKTPFTDKMYQMGDAPEYNRDDWLNEKYQLGLDFPNLPYLIDGEVKLTQSNAILYYLGRQHNLMGNNPKEEALIMMLCEQAYDLRSIFAMLCYGPNGDSPNEQKKFLETTLTKSLEQFDAYFSKNKNKFAVGDQPTVADFQVFYYVDCSCSFDGGRALLDKYINVKEFLQRIRELPELKDYIIKSQAQLPMHLKHAKFGAKYLRCDIKTELDQLCLVLLGIWDMPVPGLIMRMMSDVDSTPNIKIEKEFLQAISDAAVASVPLITVLVGGTLHAVPSIFTDLQRRIPVVIVEGSGQLADILCKYLKLTESFYKSSNIANELINDQDEIFSDHEDDADIAMINEEFSQDDAVNSPSSTQTT